MCNWVGEPCAYASCFVFHSVWDERIYCHLELQKKNNNMWFGNTFATTYIFIANFLRFFVYIFKSLLNKVKQKIILFQFCVLCLHQQHCEMRKFARKTHSSTLVRLIFFYIFYVWYEILVNLRRFIMRHVGLQIQILELKGICLGILEEIVHKSS